MPLNESLSSHGFNSPVGIIGNVRLQMVHLFYTVSIPQLLPCRRARRHKRARKCRSDLHFYRLRLFPHLGLCPNRPTREKRNTPRRYVPLFSERCAMAKRGLAPIRHPVVRSVQRKVARKGVDLLRRERLERQAGVGGLAVELGVARVAHERHRKAKLAATNREV